MSSVFEKGKGREIEVDYLHLIPAEIWIQVFQSMHDLRDIHGLTVAARTCQKFREWAVPIIYSSVGLQTHCLQLQPLPPTTGNEVDAAKEDDVDGDIEMSNSSFRRERAKKRSMNKYHAKGLPPRHAVGIFPVPRPYWCNYRYMASVSTDVDIVSSYFDEDPDDSLKPFVQYTRTVVITNECRHSDCTTLMIEPVVQLTSMKKLTSFRYAMCCSDDNSLLGSMLSKLNDPVRKILPMQELIFEDVSSVDCLYEKLPALNHGIPLEPLGPVLSNIRTLHFLWLTRLETEKLRNLLWCVKDTLRELVIAAKQGLSPFDVFDNWPGNGEEDKKLKLQTMDITFFIDLPKKVDAIKNAIDMRVLESFVVNTYRPSGLPAFILGFMGDHPDGQILLRNLRSLWIEEPLNQYEDVGIFWEKICRLPKLHRLETEIDNISLLALHDILKAQAQTDGGLSLKKLYVTFTEEEYKNLEAYLENIDMRRKKLNEMKDVGLRYIGCHERSAHVNTYTMSDKTVQPFQDVNDLSSFLEVLKNYKSNLVNEPTYNEGEEFGGERIVVKLNDKEMKAMREGLDASVTLAKPKDFFVAYPWNGAYTKLDPTGTQCICAL
ncbi:hypothetical protein H072_8091 [Dactylellina haptotyla CBS 200.50]|uniref:F-box domain-containing protein n=1 Tax=Dactylellina haptotyla (strain CBS 200.50) TaxID=1284197 RepID=S8BG02_DACHA|nr:hypothetical protein H072_8091 [Dactylellina haptotyla CBS 200.50]